MLLYHYPLMRLSKTFPKDNDNNRHPRQSFIYNTFLTDMLIYSRSRGVSAESSLFGRKLLIFMSERQYAFTPIRNKTTFHQFHHADGRKACDKDK